MYNLRFDKQGLNERIGLQKTTFRVPFNPKVSSSGPEDLNGAQHKMQRPGAKSSDVDVSDQEKHTPHSSELVNRFN